MNKTLGITALIIAIAAVVTTGFVITKSVNVKVDMPEVQFGAMATPDVMSALRVHNTFMYGGKVLATTTTATAGIVQYTDLNNYDYIDMLNMNTSATPNFTYTLPATSTMISILPDIGSTRRWLIHNASSSPTLTIATGAGMDLVSVTNADDVIDGGEWSELTCTHIYYRGADNENIECIISELANAD